MDDAPLTRRAFLAATAAATLAPLLPARARAEPARLRAAPGMAGLVIPDGPETAAWLFNGRAPGPMLRAHQGETLEVTVENALPEPTTVHWHGLRVPVEMDGVPHLSQPPIAPGARFAYRLPLEDAGTFWYHPHVRSSEQVGRGLHGLLIVDEPAGVADRLRADRDIAWAIDDWRLGEDGQILPFGHPRDASHAGRVGNVLTVNGSWRTRQDVRAGERLRLRLANVANARSFALDFGALDPWVVALDGHPVPPRRLGGAPVWLGAGQRADLVVDIALPPGATAQVLDIAGGPERAFEVMTLAATEQAPLRDAAPAPPEALPANPVAEPDLAAATEHRLVFEGGAMGGMAGATMGGQRQDMRALAQAGRFWAMNGTVPTDLYDSAPLFAFARGHTQAITLVNRTRWLHPIHLHGHTFRILARDVMDHDIAALRDTILLAPQEEARIAFVADNPGRWMLHCHVLEHQSSGMMAVVEVA